MVHDSCVCLPNADCRTLMLCCCTFAAVQVGSEFAVGPLEQQRQLEALRVLDAVLAGLVNEEGMGFGGLNFHVYHPDACPLGGFGLHHDGDAFGLGAGHIMRSHVADDGCLHVVADRIGLRESLMAMDLDRARVLTKVSCCAEVRTPAQQWPWFGIRQCLL